MELSPCADVTYNMFSYFFNYRLYKMIRNKLISIPTAHDQGLSDVTYSVNYFKIWIFFCKELRADNVCGVTATMN